MAQAEACGVHQRKQGARRPLAPVNGRPDVLLPPKPHKEPEPTAETDDTPHESMRARVSCQPPLCSPRVAARCSLPAPLTPTNT